MLNEIDQKISSDIEDLTSKQMEVLDLVVDRRTNKEIAALLAISPSAVEQRLQSVRRKFGVRSRAELARAYQHAQNTCQVSTGAKFQVDQGIEDTDYSGVNSDDVSAEGLVGSVDRSMASVPGWRRGDLQGKFLDGLDNSVGVLGRIAALTITSAAFALLILIVSKMSNS